MPAPGGATPVRAFYTPTRKSACVLFRRAGGSPFIECGVNTKTRGYRLAVLGRARSAAWQDPLVRFPGIKHKTAKYGRTLFARGLAWLPVGYSSDISCVVRVSTGIRCASPDEPHGLRVSVQFQSAY
ncbi:MAG: hypothetical protein JWO02_2359 [Solirubrobacterales bacterium]|nr:hypothetical protein [Solirubrobacterales bacterium]